MIDHTKTTLARPSGRSLVCSRANINADALSDFEARQAPAFRGLEHGPCGRSHAPGEACPECDGLTARARAALTPATPSIEDLTARHVEDAIVRAVIPNPIARRAFIKRVGQGSLAALIAGVLPVDFAKSLAAGPIKAGAIEKPDLSIGFIPITCGTPIIMAEPMGFYKKYGLNATVRKAAGWAIIRDWAVNREVDAVHMLSPMPLAVTLGAGSRPLNMVVPVIENINGQAITLHNKHKGKVKGPKDMKGFRFCVPFDYSMHNYLLRYYLAEGGLDPDKDVSIRVIPPPEMVANLKADNVDGYLAPDPFNQRAVYENAGYIFMLTKDIWPGHPCCTLSLLEEFPQKYPNTFLALWRSIIDATYFSSDPANRDAIAKAIAPANYLNQPEIVLRQVLSGRFATGLGGVANIPDRIDFDPMPWTAMAKWILSQMVRWKQVPADIDYDKVARQVYQEAGCADLIREAGLAPKIAAPKSFTIMGRTFDPARPGDYASSFSIPAQG